VNSKFIWKTDIEFKPGQKGESIDKRIESKLFPFENKDREELYQCLKQSQHKITLFINPLVGFHIKTSRPHLEREISAQLHHYLALKSI
jgi:hypothetical protein